MLASMLVALAAQAAPVAPGLAAELAPLAFLVGSCWRSTYPSGDADTHCYTAMLGGRYVRDLQVLESDLGGTPHRGETIYRWDPVARRIRYDYYGANGATSSGHVMPTPTGLDFPDETHVGADGRSMTLRYVWVRTAEGYSGTNWMREGEIWFETSKMQTTRVGPAPAPRR